MYGPEQPSRRLPGANSPPDARLARLTQRSAERRRGSARHQHTRT